VLLFGFLQCITGHLSCNRSDAFSRLKQGLSAITAVALLGLILCPSAHGVPLSVDDFSFAPDELGLGSSGATIQQLGTNHFKVVLGSAPTHPDWDNMLNVTIEEHALGNPLQLDVYFYGGNKYRYNTRRGSWSYDGVNWKQFPAFYDSGNSSVGASIYFPAFTQDKVYLGHQVPMSYENVNDLMQQWSEHPDAQLNVVGQSIEGHNIYRLQVTDAASPYARSERWHHYMINLHPGEHNSQWRMAGMVDWLLGPEGATARENAIYDFVLMASPDSPSHGWYRVNAEGYDMNRSYLVSGADPDSQAHEAYLLQSELEQMMVSSEPLTTVWGLHTDQYDIIEEIARGPEFDNTVGPWTDFRDLIETYDEPHHMFGPVRAVSGDVHPTWWDKGPYQQFGITSVLVEGGGNVINKEEALDVGMILMRSIAEFYGTPPEAEAGVPEPGFLSVLITGVFMLAAVGRHQRAFRVST